jgi:AcrR family transcriptional regulator
MARLVYTKGYERMTIQDNLSYLDRSSGAFYHYFDSKPAVLEAFIKRIQETAEEVLLHIIHDPVCPRSKNSGASLPRLIV